MGKTKTQAKQREMSEQKHRAERAAGARQVVWGASVWEGGASKDEAEMEPGSTPWVLFYT